MSFSPLSECHRKLTDESWESEEAFLSTLKAFETFQNKEAIGGENRLIFFSLQNVYNFHDALREQGYCICKIKSA